MQLNCSKENLLQGIQIIETAVSTKTTLPILSNFLLEVEQNKIKLVATDLEIAVRCFIEGKIISTGAITVPAKRFSSIIREIPTEEIQIKVVDNNQIDIRSSKSHFSLYGTSKEDFPVLPEFVEEKAVAVDCEILKEMLKKTSFAISTDETRYALTGTLVLIGENKIKFVATDGRRLAYIIRDGISAKSSLQAIVPGKAINELLRILQALPARKVPEPKAMAGSEDKKVKISITKNQVAFKVEDIVLISRVIDSEFPNYEQVIPKKHQYRIKINAKELLSATKQIALLTHDRGGAVKFSYGKQILRVSAQTQGLGSGEVDLDTDYTGSNLEIAFNPGLIVDLLKNLTEEEVIFEINSPFEACVIKAVGDENYLYVAMPVRI
ncbi:MAG: DNA polymerase III subunit beta [Elusimicrobiota bacterium]|nr:DNA polymerase III subunit beta [Elusimicrobiota bacterium]